MNREKQMGSHQRFARIQSIRNEKGVMTGGALSEKNENCLLSQKHREKNCVFLLSRPVRGAWIEIRMIVTQGRAHESRPVRGAWIEICNAAL